MEKISLNQVRGFSECITYTFNFIKQEIKPLLKSFAVIVLPLIFIDLFIKSFLFHDIFMMAFQQAEPAPADFALTLKNALLTNLSTLVLTYWGGLWGLAYLRVYQDNYARPEQPSVMPGEVLSVMWKNLGKLLVWDIFYILAIILGLVLFVAPGLYLAVIWAFVAYFIVFRGQSMTKAMSASHELIRGRWWNFFGYLILLQLIATGLSYIFSLPAGGLSLQTLFTQQAPSTYAVVLTMLLATVGQNFLSIILYVGIGMRFFSFLEEKEQTGLLNKIEQIGAEPQA